MAAQAFLQNLPTASSISAGPRPVTQIRGYGADAYRRMQPVLVYAAINQTAAALHPAPVKLEHVDFILNRAAENVIPVCIRAHDADDFYIYQGILFEASCLSDTLDLRGSKFHIRTGQVCSAQLVKYPTAAGPITTLEFIGPGNAVIAAIRGDRDQCIVWRALMAWMLLRNSRERSF